MKIFSKLVNLSAVVASLVLVLMPLSASAAGSASLNLSGSTSQVVGSTFPVTVTANSGADPVNVVQADLTYDAGKLQFVSINTSGSGFDSNASSNGGGGNVSIARFVSGGGSVSGSRKVASVNFKVISAVGSTAVRTASSSKIYRSTDNVDVWNGAISTLNVGLKAATPAPRPAPRRSTSTTPAPAVAPAPAPVTGNVQSQNNRKYNIEITVNDHRDIAVRDAAVTVKGKTVKTDASGVARFSDLSAGKHVVSVKKGDQLATQQIIVVDKPSQTSQQFKVSLPKPDDNKLGAISGGLALMSLAGGGYYLNRQRSKK